MTNTVTRAFFATIFAALSLAGKSQCYSPTDTLYPYGCDFIVEIPPIASGTVVTRCYVIEPESDNIQPGFISIQSPGCGPLAYTNLSYELWNDTCGLLLGAGGIYPPSGSPSVNGLDTAMSYVLCLTWTALCVQDAVCATYYFSPLPVELIYFRGSRGPEGINLSWMTGSERNCDRYTLQRSTNFEEWKEIRVVPGMGTVATSTTYQVEDTDPYDGVNYYRLLQHDYGGSFEIFDVVAVYYSKGSPVRFLRNFNLAGQRIF